MALVTDELITRLQLEGVETYERAMLKTAQSLDVAAQAEQRQLRAMRLRAQQMSQQAMLMSRYSMLAGGVAAAVSGMAAVSISKAMQQEDAEKALTTILGDKAQALIELAAAYQKQTRFGDEQIIRAQALMATYPKLRPYLAEATRAALNLAEAYRFIGMTVEQAAQTLGKASMGQAGQLRRIGIDIDPAKLKAEGFRAVLEQLGTETQDIAFKTDSASKALSQMKNVVGDSAEQIGKVLLPYVKQAAGFVEQLVYDFDKLSPSMKRFIVIGGGLTGIAAATGAVALQVAAIWRQWQYSTLMLRTYNLELQRTIGIQGAVTGTGITAAGAAGAARAAGAASGVGIGAALTSLVNPITLLAGAILGFGLVWEHDVAPALRDAAEAFKGQREMEARFPWTFIRQGTLPSRQGWAPWSPVVSEEEQVRRMGGWAVPGGYVVPTEQLPETEAEAQRQLGGGRAHGGWAGLALSAALPVIGPMLRAWIYGRGEQGLSWAEIRAQMRQFGEYKRETDRMAEGMDRAKEATKEATDAENQWAEAVERARMAVEQYASSLNRLQSGTSNYMAVLQQLGVQPASPLMRQALQWQYRTAWQQAALGYQTGDYQQYISGIRAMVEAERAALGPGAQLGAGWSSIRPEAIMAPWQFEGAVQSPPPMTVYHNVWIKAPDGWVKGEVVQAQDEVGRNAYYMRQGVN